MTYPEELDTDDIDELASSIERRYPTEEIHIHNTETIHFAYWDKSHRVVSAMLLDHIRRRAIACSTQVLPYSSGRETLSAGSNPLTDGVWTLNQTLYIIPNQSNTDIQTIAIIEIDIISHFK
jgi:hypothetical protein